LENKLSILFTDNGGAQLSQTYPYAKEVITLSEKGLKSFYDTLKEHFEGKLKSAS
jgi:hypothetical protein